MKRLELLIAIIILCGLSLPVQAKVVLVLWHGLQWEQLAGLNVEGPVAFGLLNTRAGGGSAPGAGYLSIGAGARAVGTSQAAAFLTQEEPGPYELNTGLKKGPIALPYIAPLLAAQNVSYTVKPGALGSALKQAGRSSLVLGCSDTQEKVRWAPLIAMDPTGRAPFGSVGQEILLADAGYPYGVRTNYELVAELVFAAAADLIVVDMGDPYRLDQYSQFLLPAQQKTLSRRMAAEGRDFLEQLAAGLPEAAVIFLLSAYPAKEKAQEGLWLTPFLAIGWEGGLLSSGTTKWPGILTNMDVAPTILNLLGVEQKEYFIGRSAYVEPKIGAESYIFALDERLQRLTRERGPILRALVIGQIVLYLASLAVLIFDLKAARLLQQLLLGFLALPLGLLLWAGPWWFGLLWGALLAFLYLSRREPLAQLLAVAAATTGAVIIDILRGSPLMRFSHLGYDPIGGARFYGVGNEFMGILVGAAVMSWALFCQLYPQRPRLRALGGCLFFAAVLAVIGAPFLGTNVGGSITAAAAFGFTWLLLEDRVNRRGLFALILLTAAVLGLFMFIDSQKRAGEQSHIGQTVALFGRDGFPALKLIIRRKLAMNLRLLRYSIWSKALLVAAAVLAASFIWPTSFIRWLMKNYPAVSQGISGVVLGSLAAFIFNDSGVVAAATCLLFASTAILILALQLKHDLGSAQPHVEDNAHSH